MKILLTGATGFIGGRLLEYLSSNRVHEMYCIARSAGHTENLEKVKWIQQDLYNKLDISLLPEKLDAIIHLAQSKNYRNFPEQAVDIFDMNVAATMQLLDYGRRAGIKSFVFASSGGVYGYKDNIIAETEPAEPQNFYTCSKYIAEQLVKAYSSYCNAIILRYFFVYGEDQPDMLIPNLISAILSGRPIVIHNKEGRRLNPIYVGDAARAAEAALAIDGFETINVAGAQVVTFLELTELIGRLLNKRPQFDFVTEDAPIDIVADMSKMRTILGVVPEVVLEDGLTRVIRVLNRG